MRISSRTRGMRSAVAAWCALTEGPMSAAQVGEKIGQAAQSVRTTLGVLERLGVCVHDGYGPPIHRGSRPQLFRLSAPGDGPTASAGSRRMDYEEQLHKLVGQLDLGTTKSEIHAKVQIGESELTDIIKRLRAAKLIHRSGWICGGWNGEGRAEVYSLGAPRAAAPRPKPLTRAEICRRHRQRAKTVEAGGGGYSVFTALASS